MGPEKNIYPAKKYEPVDGFCVITSYYNSHDYASKLANYHRFAESIENSGIQLFIVECAFGDQPFGLPERKNIIKVRSNDILWQKERLLNIAIERLPAKYKKVAWVDADVLFENPFWVKETAEKLDFCTVVQPFTEAIRLPKGAGYYSGAGERYRGFAGLYKRNPSLLLEGKFEYHGHTGFAWATHTRILKKYGLYDACLSGSGDHLMSHSFVGDWDNKCVKRIFGMNTAYMQHYTRWSSAIYGSVKAKMEDVEGALLHLWHGSVENRNYADNQKKLESFGYNPESDLALNKDKCWEWNHRKDDFKYWADEYFALRKED